MSNHSYDSYPWSDYSLKCCLCANRFGIYPYRFYRFFDDEIYGVKINEALSTMFPYGNFSRDSMTSDLICQCCFIQAIDMSRTTLKWRNCFRQMDAIKNQFSHLRERNDFDYFLNSTASRRFTSGPSTSSTANQYGSASTVYSISSTESQYRPTSSAYSSSSTENQHGPTSPAYSTSSTEIQYRPTSSAYSTSSTESENRPTSSASSTSSTESEYLSTSSASSTTSTESEYRPTSSAYSTSSPESEYRPTSSVPSTIVSGSTHNEDNSDNLSTSSESSTIVSENENNEEEDSNMMASTHNTYINILSNQVYSKSGAYYSCIIPSCRSFFKTFHKFKMHYRHHRNVNGLMCWTCTKVLSNMSELRKHKYEDSCKFPGMFVCVLCNESFNDLQSVSHHKYVKHIKN